MLARRFRECPARSVKDGTLDGSRTYIVTQTVICPVTKVFDRQSHRVLITTGYKLQVQATPIMRTLSGNYFSTVFTDEGNGDYDTPPKANGITNCKVRSLLGKIVGRVTRLTYNITCTTIHSSHPTVVYEIRHETVHPVLIIVHTSNTLGIFASGLLITWTSPVWFIEYCNYVHVISVAPPPVLWWP